MAPSTLQVVQPSRQLGRSCPSWRAVLPLDAKRETRSSRSAVTSRHGGACTPWGRASLTKATRRTRCSYDLPTTRPCSVLKKPTRRRWPSHCSPPVSSAADIHWRKCSPLPWRRSRVARTKVFVPCTWWPTPARRRRPWRRLPAACGPSVRRSRRGTKVPQHLRSPGGYEAQPSKCTRAGPLLEWEPGSSPRPQGDRGQPGDRSRRGRGHPRPSLRDHHEDLPLQYGVPRPSIHKPDARDGRGWRQ